MGHPVAILTEGNLESLRFFRGFVQRAFLHHGRFGHTYSAYELSFPAPPGFSGGPVFADDHPDVLLGVITENFASYTVVESIEETIAPGNIRRTEVRSTVTYGIAANPASAISLLEAAIPVGNLNAAESKQKGRTPEQ